MTEWEGQFRRCSRSGSHQPNQHQAEHNRLEPEGVLVVAFGGDDGIATFTVLSHEGKCS